MENEAGNKFTWVIKTFLEYNFSGVFMIGGYKWYLVAFSSTHKYLSLGLRVNRYSTLPRGWRIHAKCRLTLVNQLSEKHSLVQEKQHWFDEERLMGDYPEMITLSKLHEKDSGFLVNNKLKIVAEIHVLEVVGIKSQEVTQPLKRIKLQVHGETLSLKETIDVHGFQVLLSQAESVKLIFQKHPNIASDFRAKNHHQRTSCMNALLNLIETLCQSLQDLSIDDLGQGDNALTYLKISGFKVDWLERKLEEVKEKKMEQEIGETRMQELKEKLKGFKQKYSGIEALLEKKKEELKDLKHKWSDTEALLEKEKAKVLAARVPPLTLDDVV
ncbi:hypothetical protein AALP_AA5G206600 [Arabis alpina]|uniref:MATH domain-containing protein n=1 Tax=Arabis alpina TaxID=50452 RepID=A0A087GYD7_ARAAL|nr:hypothetical protein AALP_AA5G206600 [Arabis alpina]